MVNLDIRQSRPADGSASIVKRAKERFRNSESWRKRSRRSNATIIQRVENINKLFLSA